MKQELKIIRANPAGNTTLLIEGLVQKEDYAQLGAALLQEKGLEAEQAGFICLPQCGGAGRLEMSGGEFCGNASRAFGYYLAQQQGRGSGSISIEISGCENLIDVEFDCRAGIAYAAMPLPDSIKEIEIPELGKFPLVCFSGIWHVIAHRIPAKIETFLQIREAVMTAASPNAFGVMFLDETCTRMTPIVYVRGPETVCWESSCGSGSTAVAFWLAGKKNQNFFRFEQPGGVLEVKIQRSSAKIDKLVMGGQLTLEPPIFHPINHSCTDLERSLG